MLPTSPLWFSISVLIVSVLSLIYTYFNNKFTNQKSEEAIKLYQGFLEVNIHKTIVDAIEMLQKTTRSMLFFKNKYPAAPAANMVFPVIFKKVKFN